MNLKLVFSVAFSLIWFYSTAQSELLEYQNNELHEDVISIELSEEDITSADIDTLRSYIDPSLEITEADVKVLQLMKSCEKTIPLHYTAQVKYYIDKYISNNYRPYMSRLLGLSKHYFTVYDQILEEANLPKEIKYISLIESSLNPHLVSRSGAVGPWQFMYATAKSYNLEMNNLIDERKDIYASTYAMANYLKEAYQQFGDWQLALASYNCGRGCVKRAIERSGLENPNFWQLAPYLPAETRNYIPKFIAMTYTLSNASFYQIEAVSTELDHAHKLVHVEKNVNLSHIANALGISLNNLKSYNPFYKKSVVNGSVSKPRKIIIPLTEGLNDSLLYVALNSNLAAPVIVEDLVASKYRVKKGETIYSVSKKFGVSVQDLRSWNNLTSKSAVVGRTLVLEKPVDTKMAARVSKSKDVTSSKIVYYTVKSGDSLDRIANRHQGATVEKIKRDNALKSNLIKPGMKLKIIKG